MIKVGVCEIAVGVLGSLACVLLVPESAETAQKVIGTLMGTAIGQGIAFVVVGIWDRLHN